MSKKPYAIENETLSIVTPPNETYDDREISVVVPKPQEYSYGLEKV